MMHFPDSSCGMSARRPTMAAESIRDVTSHQSTRVLQTRLQRLTKLFERNSRSARGRTPLQFAEQAVPFNFAVAQCIDNGAKVLTEPDGRNVVVDLRAKLSVRDFDWSPNTLRPCSRARSPTSPYGHDCLRSQFPQKGFSARSRRGWSGFQSVPLGRRISKLYAYAARISPEIARSQNPPTAR